MGWVPNKVGGIIAFCSLVGVAILLRRTLRAATAKPWAAYNPSFVSISVFVCFFRLAIPFFL